MGPMETAADHGRSRGKLRRIIPPIGHSASRRSKFWIALAAGALVIGSIAERWSRMPLVEPPFEQIVGEASGPIVWFDLADASGVIHTTAEWAGRPAIVLFFIARDCPGSIRYRGEMTRLASVHGPRGVLFLGVDVSGQSFAEGSSWSGLPFPVVYDSGYRVASQAGASVTPEAVVLTPDGQVVYKGRIDDRIGSEGRFAERPTSRELEAAIVSLVAGEAPRVATTPAIGRPIPIPPTTRSSGDRVTFTEHIAPILWRRCAGCHRPGEVAPFSLLKYKDAAKRADDLVDVVLAERMPPWKPRAGAGVFLDAPRLSSLEKETLRIWAETGRAEGDPDRLPAAPRWNDDWRLGKPDLILTMPEPFTVPAGGNDIYQFLRLPVCLDHDVTIEALEFRPGNRRVVHHTRIYLDATGDARRRDLADPAPGFLGWFDAPDGMDVNYPGLGAWTPGMTPRFAPEGVGRLIKKDADVVLRTHYHPSGKVEVDRSQVGLYFAKKPVTKTMAGYTLCTAKIDIPPGENRHRILLSTRLKADVHLHSIVPHAHALCREFRLAATLPDGTILPLLWITDWDFDWQDQYRYVRPVGLPRGTVVTLAAYFDNSSGNPRNPNNPPRRVRYGGGTKDEMCACHLEFMPDDPSGHAAYPARSPFGL